MHSIAIRTHRVEKGEDIISLLDRYLPSVEEGSVVAITSKVLSICQGRVVQKEKVSKEALIKREADAVLNEGAGSYGIVLTLKEGLLIPSAGIDESNGEGVYILYPKDIQTLANQLWRHLRQKHKREKIGVLITDSHTTPLRRGVTGIALGWCGFKPLYSYIGKPDLYGHPLRVTQTNLIDGLAATAVLMMGEGNEQTPFVVITEAPKMEFLARVPTREEQESTKISMEEDLYGPLFKNGNWQRGD